MSLSKQLNRWIAESESWQAFIDFDLPEVKKAQYRFLKKWDEFFISLMSSGFDCLDERNDKSKENLLAVARGLVIYSLDNKREYFSGVNYQDNILYASAYYYLSGYPASAYLLAHTIPVADYNSEIDIFISSFLRRELSIHNRYSKLLDRYLKSGRMRFLGALYRLLTKRKNEALEEGSDFASFKLAESLIDYFYSDNIWVDLLEEDDNVSVWEKYVLRNIAKPVPIWSFFPSQRKAIKADLLSNSSFSLQMPTSAGKTSLSELLIYYSHKTNTDNKILYLAPFRSLASELKLSMGRDLASLGISVKSIYGGHVPSKEEQEAIQSVDLLIATPEKLMAVEDVLPDLFESYKTIICDEGHLLDDENRGLSYELLLSRLKSSNVKDRRFIFISAIIPNIQIINEWLGGNEETLVESTYRPTQLEFAFLKKRATENIYDLDVNPLDEQPKNYQLYNFLTSSELKYYNGETNRKTSITSKKGITTAVALKAIKTGSVAVFCPTKRGGSGVEDIADEVIKQLNQAITPINALDGTEIQIAGQLAEYMEFIFGRDYLLSKLCRYGALYHHGDLPQNAREVIENSLRKSQIRLVICTNTLAEGINLPIRTMIVHGTSRYTGNGWTSLKNRELKNLVGRAGRAGKETSGLIIVPHSKDFKKMEQVIEDDNVEDVNGWLYELIKRITATINRKKIELSNEVLDSQNEEFLNWLDSIDLALVDLLAEDVEAEELQGLVQELIQQTLSYSQANDDQKETLNQIFILRSEKLEGYIQNKQFKAIKNSGTTLRSYEKITETFDLDNGIWNEEFGALEKNWISYILTDGIFKMESFTSSLQIFNEENRCELKNEDITEIIEDWMSGQWYDEICQTHKLEMFQVLKLINGFISFHIQNLTSSVIRVKMQSDDQYSVPNTILNWPLYLQYGISTGLEVALFELGLNDRVMVIALRELLIDREYEYKSFNELQAYLLENEGELIAEISDRIPKILIPRLTTVFILIRSNIF